MFKRKKLKILSILFTVIIITASLSHTILAFDTYPWGNFETIGKALQGGIYNRTYYIGMGANSYIQPAVQAIEDWNKE